MKKDTKIEWAEAQENAFQHLKSKLTKQPILRYPDLSEFILTTDASNQGLSFTFPDYYYYACVYVLPEDIKLSALLHTSNV